MYHSQNRNLAEKKTVLAAVLSHFGVTFVKILFASFSYFYLKILLEVEKINPNPKLTLQVTLDSS